MTTNFFQAATLKIIRVADILIKYQVVPYKNLGRFYRVPCKSILKVQIKRPSTSSETIFIYCILLLKWRTFKEFLFPQKRSQWRRSSSLAYAWLWGWIPDTNPLLKSLFKVFKELLGLIKYCHKRGSGFEANRIVEITKELSFKVVGHRFDSPLCSIVFPSLAVSLIQQLCWQEEVGTRPQTVSFFNGKG